MANDTSEQFFLGFDWSEALKTGHGEIDSQHQKLFNLLSEIKKIVSSSRLNNACDSIVSQLVEYAGYHLNYEESVFRNNEKYNASREHINQHNKFRRMLKKVSLNNISISDLKFIHAFVYDWLVYHIGVTDYEMIDAIGDAHKGEWGGETVDQTRKVTSELFKLTVDIDKKASLFDPLELKKSYDYAESLKRMINLLLLLQERIELFGATDRILSILKAVQNSVYFVAYVVILNYMDDAISYCQRILEKKHGVPLGFGHKILNMLGNIDPVFDLVCKSGNGADDVKIKHQKLKGLVNELGILNLTQPFVSD
jgi:hemerythrin-like metal-binding protein